MEGFSGALLSAAELRERISVICLAAKKKGWTPEPDDRDFELTSRYCFLTGTSSKPPYDWDPVTFTPPRHGLVDSMVDNEMNDNMNDDDGDPIPMPMHPTCFEIFARQSMAKTGSVDIDGLWKLREHNGDFSTRFEGLSRRPDVELTCQQDFSPERGTEYVAATPLCGSALDAIILRHQAEEADSVVFDASPSAPDDKDPFSALSHELQAMILMQLGMRDIADLRLSSRCFRQLPQTYFRHIVRSEMPYIWASSALLGGSIDWHGLWWDLAASDGGACLDEQERQAKSKTFDIDLTQMYADIKDLTGLTPPDKDFHGVYQERRLTRIDENTKLCQAERETGKWRPHRELHEIRGLRSLQRIWGDVADVLRLIGELTREQRGDVPLEEVESFAPNAFWQKD